MTLLSNLDTILQDGRKAYERRRSGHDGTDRFYCREQLQHTGKIGSGQNEKSKNMLVRGDNLDFMEHLIQNCDMAGKLDLIYIDPPFFSNANYKARTKIQKKGSDQAVLHIQDAYTDTWEYGEREYLTMLTERLIYMHELLKDEGCIFIHLDWHIVHYVKVIADEIFGMQNFVNEIIWQYKSGGAGKRHFGRKHDTILFYAKTKKYHFYPQKEKSYNRELRPYHFKGVQEYQDETGWYTMVYMKDVWPIDMVGRTSKERVDYATQKPEALLERIIQSCTKEGDICADFFAGSGTLAAAADRLSRNWICCDNGALAIAKMQKRLCVRQSEYDFYEEKEQDSYDERQGTADEKKGIAARQNERARKEIEQIKIKTCLQPSEVVGKIKLEIILDMADEHLLDYWSVDYGFDRIHRPEMHFFRTGGEIRTKAEKTADAFHKISIKITDIGGNVRYEVITMREKMSPTFTGGGYIF